MIEFNSGFKICTVIPKKVVPCFGTTNISDSIAALPSILTVTKDEDIDLLTYFQRVMCTVSSMHNHKLQAELLMVEQADEWGTSLGDEVLMAQKELHILF